jgi:hypothetical protein
MDKVRILYVASDSRSGSTALDLMLGQGEGLFSVGEMRHIWQRSYMKNELCGCTQPFRECAFWGNVTEQAFGSFAEADRIADYLADAAPTRVRHMPLLMTLWQKADSTEALDTLCDALSRVYSAIQQISGASVIVDSSKSPTYGLILSRIPTLDVSIVHLVRDSRAVAYSWQRKKLRTEVHWQKEYMPRFSLMHSARAWMVNNMMVQALIHQTGRDALFLRYESLMDDPDAAMDCTRAFLAERGVRVSFPSYANGVVPIRQNHTVAGNPIRINRTGELKLRLDSEWQQQMGQRQQKLVTTLTAPLLKRYGYIDVTQFDEATSQWEKEGAH